ncbi:unnamed protein product [Blepharisma stoltei]|uniref:Cilia- and flagella-associated protein 418 n=1 Tax=Blepharisma stoltei TaxID=1481888 RepID=A0AAU9JCS3_9CILI|nr:unnamed protein product [Blepharisma stoltei]
MRSKLDDLLDELNDIDEHPQPIQMRNQQPLAVQTKKNKSSHREIDDLLDLVNDIDSPEPEKPAYVPSYQIPVSNSSRLQKCYPLCIGGSNLEVGICFSSASLKCCNKMRCTKCDLSVKRYQNKIWKDGCNYLFFRNNYSRDDMLQPALADANGFCAYFCQCQWRNVNEPVVLRDNQWVCGGHLGN